MIYGGGFGTHDTGSASGGAGGYGPCVQTFRACDQTAIKTLDTGLGQVSLVGSTQCVYHT